MDRGAVPAQAGTGPAAARPRSGGHRAKGVGGTMLGASAVGTF